MFTSATDRLEFVSESSEKSSFSLNRLSARIFQNRYILTSIFLLLDLTVLFEVYALTSYVWHSMRGSAPLGTGSTLIVLFCCVPLALFLLDRYTPDTTSSLEQFRQHLLANVLGLAISAVVLYLFVTYQFAIQPSRATLLLTFVAFTPFSFWYRKILSKAIAEQKAKNKFVVIGSGELAKTFFKDYKRALMPQKLQFVSIDKKGAPTHIEGKDSPAVETDLERVLNSIDHDHDGVIIAEHLSELDQNLVLNLTKLRFQRTSVYTLETFMEKHWGQIPLQTMNGLWPLQSGFQLSHGSMSVHAKRLLDVLVSGSGLFLLSPFLLFVAALVKLESRGPAIFKQVRIGKNAKPFTMYKFRSMTQNADKGDMYTRKNDSRITKLGAFMRATRIDELPQLWNVFKGDMSLIGPRAEWVKCVEIYEESIPDYHFRHLVKPGITGWAQVRYPYGESEEDTKMKLKYDLYYVRHFSTLFDLSIAFKTIRVIIAGLGR